MRSFLMTFIVVITVLSCKRKEVEIPVAVGKITDTLNKNVVDTILAIDSLNFTDLIGSSTLTEAIAQKVLKDYYAAKGIHNYDTDYQDEEGNQMCAYYDTIYKCNLNNDRHEEAIISYWLMPCLSSGTCFQPTRAIITKINGKYKLISAELLPSYFNIDTVTSDKTYNYLNFYKFNCPEPGVVKRYKSKIPRN